MAATATRIINYPMDLFKVPLTGSTPNREPDSNTANHVSLGCLEEGAVLTWSFSGSEVKTQCFGDTPIDEIVLGVNSMKLEGILQEPDTETGGVRNIDELIWPEGDFGVVTNQGKMVNYDILSTVIYGVPKAGYAAATNTTAWWFYSCYASTDDEFDMNFNLDYHAVPLQLKMYPVIVLTDISVNHYVVYPSDDVSGLTLADYDNRFCRRIAT